MRERSSPSTSPTVCTSRVDDPWPISAAPESTTIEPSKSSLILTVACASPDLFTGLEAALVAFAFHRGDPAVLAHAELESDIRFRPAAMRDERFLAVDHQAHAAVGLAREQGRDQLDIKRFRAAAEAAADMRFDHTDARH